jgi:sugar phosphate isomerase/epimerase
VIALKLALDLATLEQPPLASLQSAAELGVEGVVIDARGDFALLRLSQTGIRQLRKTLADSRLRAAAVRFRTRRGYSDLADLDARIEATKKALNVAYALGAGVVLNHVGRLPSPDSADWNTFREVLNDLGRFGQRVGAMLAAETGADSPADLARLLAALEPAALGVDLDPGALVLGGHAPLEVVETLGTSILHVHLTDARRDSFAGRGRFVPPGEGSADLPALLSALEAHDYRGWLTVRPTENANPVEQAAETIRNLRKF